MQIKETKDLTSLRGCPKLAAPIAKSIDNEIEKAQAGDFALIFRAPERTSQDAHLICIQWTYDFARLAHR